MSGTIIMQGKTETIYIRCTKELKDKMRLLFVLSGEKNYADFLEKLLILYEKLMDKTGYKKISDVIKSMDYDYVLVN